MRHGGGSPGAWPPGAFLRELEEDDRAALLLLGRARRFATGKALMRLAEPGDEAYVLLDGCVKVAADSPDGRSILLGIRVAGDVVGELAVLDGGPRDATVTAVTPTLAHVVEGRLLLRYLETRPRAALAMQRAVAAKLRSATRQRVEANGAPVRARVARALVHLALGQSRPTGPEVGVPAPLTQAELAALVGASLPSVQRALAALRDEGLLATGYRRLTILDLAGLREIA